MLAKIKAERVVVRGEPKWRILELKNFKSIDECPKEYGESFPCMGLNVDRDTLYIWLPQKGSNIPLPKALSMKGWGGLYDDKYLKDAIKWAKICGSRLATINKKQKELEQSWKGEKTFTI